MRADRPQNAATTRPHMADEPETETVTTVETIERVGVPAERADEIAGDRVELTPYEFRRPWMRAFISVLARTGDAASAARAAEINHTHAFDVRKTDPVFAAAWREAKEIADDLLEQQAIRRATTGEERVLTRTTRKFQTVPGEKEGDPPRHVLIEETVVEERVNVKSDALLMFLLKARRPEQFRERIDPRHLAAGDGPVSVEVYRFPDLARARALAALLAEEAEREHPDVPHTNGANGILPELPPGPADG